MGCGVVGAVGFEDGDAVGTGIEIGIGQAVVRGWDGVLFGEKGVGDQVVKLRFRSLALCLLIIIGESFTLASKGVNLRPSRQLPGRVHRLDSTAF